MNELLKKVIRKVINKRRKGVKIFNTSDFAKVRNTKIYITATQINEAWKKVIKSNNEKHEEE